MTPEAPDAETAFQGHAPNGTLSVTPEMLTQAKRDLSPARRGKLDMVALGTPHFSLTEFRRLAAEIEGKRVNRDVTLYIPTARFVADAARAEGLLDLIERAGAEVLTDTCTYFSPAVRACRGRVMTSSAKWAFYAPGMLHIEVGFGSLEDCVASAAADEIAWSHGF